MIVLAAASVTRPGAPFDRSDMLTLSHRHIDARLTSQTAVMPSQGRGIEKGLLMGVMASFRFGHDHMGSGASRTCSQKSLPLACLKVVS